MSITERKHVSEIGSDTGRRLEISTGAGRQRSWSVDQKAAIVAQRYDGAASVCDVARQHGLTPFTTLRVATGGSAAPRYTGIAFVRRSRRRSRRRAQRAWPADKRGWRYRGRDGRHRGACRSRRRRDDDHRRPARVEGRLVIGPSGTVKVMIATKPVDLLLRLPHAAGRAIEVAGHDVPADPASSQMIQRRQAAGDSAVHRTGSPSRRSRGARSPAPLPAPASSDR
jgi:transposase-like protein